MDIQKKKQKKVLTQKHLLAISIICISLLAWELSGDDNASVNRDQIVIANVQQKDFPIVIEGFGKFYSNKQQVITSYNEAIVKELYLKPGAPVTEDSVVMLLENPKLNQALDSENRELVQANATLKQLHLNQKREMLIEQSKLAKIDGLYESAAFELKAQNSLKDSGVVSMLTLKKSELNAKQQNKQLEIQKNSIQQLKLLHQESISIQQEKIKQQLDRVASAQNALSRLKVTAGIDGVIQSLNVDLGTSIAAGGQLALVASVTDLAAGVQVPQNKTHQIRVGQEAQINYQIEKVIGQVFRIDPSVKDNTVTVEVRFPDSLPDSALPNMNVAGVIVEEVIHNAFFIERPVNVRPNATIQLYRLNPEQTEGELVDVKFGKESGKYIQIVTGANIGDAFIISDMSSIKTNKIKLHN